MFLIENVAFMFLKNVTYVPYKAESNFFFQTPCYRNNFWKISTFAFILVVCHIF